MAKARIVAVREETPEEASLRGWFARQALASPETLEAAARLIVGLVTGLLTVLFAVLAVAGDPLPAYLRAWYVRWPGVVSVAALLVTLLAALAVVYPRRIEVRPSRPGSQEAAFAALLRFKARWLAVAVVAFGVGVAALGAALIGALVAV